MKVTVEELSPSKRALHIELPSERVAATTESALKELGRRIHIPGFRKGKAPTEIIQRRFQADIQEEVLRELIPDSYRQALSQVDFTPVSEPRVEDVHFHAGEPLKYRAVVDVKPSLEVKDYRGVPLERGKVEVTDPEVDRAVEYLREEAAEYVPMEGWPALRDDLIVLDHDGTIHGKVFKGGSGKNLTLVLGRGGYLPGFEEQLAGLKKGESKQFTLAFPEDFPRKDVAGRTAEFRVTIKEVKKRRLPELNDEFAKTVGDVESLAGLRDKLRQQLTERKNRDQEAELRRTLLEKLAASVEVELPESLVEAEAASILRDMLGMARMAGTQAREVEQNAQKMGGQALEVARRRVKHSLVLEAVARQEGLAVTDAEVTAEIENMVAAYPTDRGAAVRQAMEDPDRRDGLKARLLERKALDFLYRQANVTEAYNLIMPAGAVTPPAPDGGSLITPA
jgi:trigger factor